MPTNYFSYMMNYELNDTVSWTKSKHLLQFGGNLGKMRRNGREYFQKDPQWSFTGTRSGNAGYGYADFFLGAANSVYQNSPLTSYQYKWTPFLYFQDDWRISKKLTLNLGVRWEPYITTRDKYEHEAAFRPGEQSKVYPNAPLGVVFPGDPGIEAGITPNRYNKFSPRIGFAYDPGGDGKTSIRGGYGIFSDTLRLVALNGNAPDQPFSYGLTTFSVQFADPYAANPAPLQLLQNYQAPTNAQQRAAQPFYPPLSLVSIDPNFTTGYIQQWNVNVQREVWKKIVITAGYVGSKGTRLLALENVNPAIYIPGQSTTANVNARRPYPAFQNIASVLSVANSTYHSLQLNWNKRFDHGFTLLGSYVWSKAIDLDLERRQQRPRQPGLRSLQLEQGQGPRRFRRQAPLRNIVHLRCAVLQDRQCACANLARRLAGERHLDATDRLTIHGVRRGGPQPRRRRLGPRRSAGTGGHL